ncbi:TPA: hypothetical protein JIR19_07490 [Acinetobacter baumannii]|nr:hypothetical protein [Acinetobacter baumannii]
MNFLLSKLIENLYYKIYLSGIATLIVYILLRELNYSEIILFIGILIVEVGFVVWAIQYYKNKIKGKPFFTFLFGIINLIVLWISNVYAQELIVQSLGLPAEDFSLTLHLLTLICYIPAGIIVTIIIFFTVYLIIFLFLMLIILKNSIYYGFIHTFLVIADKANIDDKPKINHKIFLHFFSFSITCLLLINSLSFTFKHQIFFYPSIRYIAYIVDYQYLYNYPNIDKDKKVKLHANNYFSIMEGSGQNLKVIVKKIED